MKKKVLILALMLSVLLLGFGTSQAATSALDNKPGGAGISYWQAGAGYEALINVQNITAVYKIVHVTLWDGLSVHILDWNHCLTPNDNIGIIIRANNSTGSINISDYSDSQAGYNTIPAYPATTVNATSSTVTSAGAAYGYMTMAESGTGATCALAAASIPTYANTAINVPDSLYIRTALVAPTEAFAMNGAMLQGFRNIPGINDAAANFAGGSSLAGTSVEVAAAKACSNLDGNTAIGTAYASLDDANGINIDFYELLITRNAATLGANLIHVLGTTNACTFYNALGAESSANPNYYARYNATTGLSSTNVVTVAPDRSRAPATARFFHWSNTVSQMLYNDDEIANSTAVTCTQEVCFIPIGTGVNQLNPGGATAGEIYVRIAYPIFGFSFTTTAGYADLYPFVKSFVNSFDVRDADNSSKHLAGAGSLYSLGFGLIMQ